MYKFIKTRDPKNSHDFTNVEVNIDFGDVTLTDMLEAFEEFLKGCGFHIDGQSLDLVSKEEE